MNILLITSDQQHFSTLGAVNPKIRTPALDRLCREGARFDRAYCPNPTCTPTRASLITGLYPSYHGAWSLGTKLPEDVPTVGDTLQHHGFRTFLVGKAHFQQLANHPDQPSIESYPTLRDLDFWRHFHGPWYGFEHVETTRPHADEAHVGGHYAIWLEEQGLTDWRNYFQPYPKDPQTPTRKGSWDLPERYHYSVWTAERTIANLRDSVERGQPFFGWASFHDPHPPYLVPEPWASMYDPADMEPGEFDATELERMPPHFQMTKDRDADWSVYRETPWANHGFHEHGYDPDAIRRDMAIYYGMTSLMDREIGRIVDALDELGVADETLIVFTSDHGHFLGQHGLIAKGAFHYEDAVRVPMIVRWPGRVPAGRVDTSIQSLVDYPLSFLRAAGITDGPMMQGVDQTPVWRGEASAARDHAVVEMRHQPTAVHLRTYVFERYKLTIYRGQPYGELFDLAEDPQEKRNLWDEPGARELKGDLYARALDVELQREPLRHPRVAHA